MLARSGGNRFAILHLPAARAPVGAIVYIHPFAEEMNKSRRAAALGARSFSCIGWAVLQLDLLGCGDSSGEFEDASWEAWIEDALFAIDWLQQRTTHRPLLWSIRSGSLLASAALSRSGQNDALILWQPVMSGQATLTQFLRLRVAADAFAGEGPRSSAASLRERLAAGEVIDVAGYQLTAALALPMDQSELLFVSDRCRGGLWLEAAGGGNSSLSHGGENAVERFRSQGVSFEAHALGVEAFWQSPETTAAPEFVAATCAYLTKLREHP